MSDFEELENRIQKLVTYSSEIKDRKNLMHALNIFEKAVLEYQAIEKIFSSNPMDVVSVIPSTDGNHELQPFSWKDM